MYRRTFGLPVIVTEFCMTVGSTRSTSGAADQQSFDPGVPAPKDQQQVHDFMGMSIPVRSDE
jgi:hypothetical protein